MTYDLFGHVSSLFDKGERFCGEGALRIRHALSSYGATLDVDVVFYTEIPPMILYRYTSQSIHLSI